jgi:integrase
MRARGLGHVYQPTYRDRATCEVRHSPTWWIKYSYHGKPFRESSKSSNRNVAVALLKKRLGEMGLGLPPSVDAEKVTFGDLTRRLLDDYEMNGRRSLRRIKIAVDHLTNAFGMLRAVDITTTRIVDYIKTRQGSVKPATISAELAALKRMFTLAIQAQLLTPAHRPHVPTLTLDNARQGFFEHHEYEAVLARLPADVQPVVTFAYVTGWRVPSEVLTLTWPQVDFAEGEVRLEPGTTKNKAGRTFPFALLPSLGDLLQRQRARVEAIEKATETIIRHVFVRDDGTPIKDFRKAWKNATQAAGLVGRIPHDFRRSAVRNLERAGVPRSVAMKLTGHKTVSVYSRYAIAAKSDLADAVSKLATLHEQDRHGQRKVVALGSRTVKAQSKQARSTGT